MTWQLNGNLATGQVLLADNNWFEVTLDVNRPGPGIAAMQFGGKQLDGFWQEITGNLFASPPGIDELYVRGSDVVCQYAEHQGSHLTPTIYWSLQPTDDQRAILLDLRIAVQTSTLGTQPETQIRWHWPEGQYEEFALSESLILQLTQESVQPLPYLDPSVTENYRFALIDFEGDDLRLLPMVHLSDYAGEQFGTLAENHVLNQKLSLPLLEKGVIRTARIRCLIAPRSLSDDELLRQTLEYFQSTLPLAT